MGWYDALSLHEGCVCNYGPVLRPCPAARRWPEVAISIRIRPRKFAVHLSTPLLFFSSAATRARPTRSNAFVTSSTAKCRSGKTALCDQPSCAASFDASASGPTHIAGCPMPCDTQPCVKNPIGVQCPRRGRAVRAPGPHWRALRRGSVVIVNLGAVSPA